jgi:sulfur relay (sulfurtransferase) complex TusBCD TusD component (DsrE family)
VKIGVILETKEPEKAWNAFRFATTGRRSGHEVQVFLMGEAVECEGLHDAKFDVAAALAGFVEAGGTMLACGTCLKSRKMDATDVCPISTMVDCVNLVTWADRVVTF